MSGTVHATAVAVRGAGVLLIGAPGSGKSDLALRLIDRGAVLIADDRVGVDAVDGAALLSPPPTIAGLIEVRGLGIVRMAHLSGVPAALAVRVDVAPDRLPEPSTFDLAGCAIPSLALSPFEASAPMKVELAVARLAARG
ncbi:MAG: HPr kinase/phosphorylase [Sphingomonadaceae bacterium]